MPYDPSHSSIRKKPAPSQQQQQSDDDSLNAGGAYNQGNSGAERGRSPSDANQRPLSSSGPNLTVNPNLSLYNPPGHPSSPRATSPNRPTPSSPKFPNQSYQAYRPPAQKEYKAPASPGKTSPGAYAAYHPPSSPPIQQPAAKPSSPLSSAGRPSQQYGSPPTSYAAPSTSTSQQYGAPRPPSPAGYGAVPSAQSQHYGSPPAPAAVSPASQNYASAKPPTPIAYGAAGGGHPQRYDSPPSSLGGAPPSDSIVSTPGQYGGKRKDTYFGRPSGPANTAADHPEQYYQATQMQGAQQQSPPPQHNLMYGGAQVAAQAPDGSWGHSNQQPPQQHQHISQPPQASALPATQGQHQNQNQNQNLNLPYPSDGNQYHQFSPGSGVQPGPKRQYSIPITTSVYELASSAADAAAAARTKTITVQLPESGVYAERVDGFMKMLEHEASLEPSMLPTKEQLEPADLVTRRNNVFKKWVLEEAQKRGPNFATELADELDGLSFGASRTLNTNRLSTQLPLSDPSAHLSPRGAAPPQSSRIDQEYFHPPQQQHEQQQAVQSFPIDITLLLPLLYPQVPANPSAASKLAPYSATYSSISDLSIADKKREDFRKKQEDMDKVIKRETEDIRKRRRNSKEAEAMIRELKKRESADAYARFERDVVNEAYPALMKQGELLEEVRTGVEGIITGSSAIILTPAEKLEILSFLEDVQKTSTACYHQMETLLAERSMQYLQSITTPLYDAGNVEEAKKAEAWNAKTMADHALQAKKDELAKVEKYTRTVATVTDAAMKSEKNIFDTLIGALDQVMRQVDACLRVGGRLDIIIPPNEPVEFDRNSEAGKLVWLKNKLLTAAVLLQSSQQSQNTLQKVQIEAKRLSIAANAAVEEALVTAKYPDNIAKRNEEISKVKENQSRKGDSLLREEGKQQEDRSYVWKQSVEGPLRPINDALKFRAIQAGGESIQVALSRPNSEESILGW